MIMTNKLLPVALVAALIGGSVGAFVMHTRNQTATESQTAQATLPSDSQLQAGAAGSEQYSAAEFNTASEQNAYKNGFADGFRSAEGGVVGVNTSQVQASRPRVVYRNAARGSSTQRRVYYDYQQPRSRSFWQKHRDKLTVAAGTGGGALIGGLIGGKKGAVIGALSGAGGSALYTYKIRNRSRRY